MNFIIKNAIWFSFFKYDKQKSRLQIYANKHKASLYTYKTAILTF